MEIINGLGIKIPDSWDVVEEYMNCPKHGLVLGVYRMRDGEPFFRGNNACPLCEKERMAKEEEWERQEAEKRAEKERIRRYAEANIEPEFYEKTLDDYKPQTARQAEFVDSVRTLIERKSGKLIVLGGNGTGKSMLGAVAAKAMDGVIYTVFQLSLKIRSLGKKDMSEWQFANSLIDAPLLVIDEVGRSKGSDFELNLLSYILDKRHTRNRPFVILSNAHFSRECPHGSRGCERCFERYFDNDLLSRFRQDGKFIELEKDAPDWRDPRNRGLFEK